MEKHMEHLKRTRAQLLDEISSTEEERFNRRVDEASWTVAQVCHHLVLSEALYTAAIRAGMSRGDSGEVQRRPVHLVLDRSVKVQAPDGTEPSLENFQSTSMVELLGQSRMALLDVLQSIDDASSLQKRSVVHPIFGDMLLDQWIELLYLHEQRHVEQIKELKASAELAPGR